MLVIYKIKIPLVLVDAIKENIHPLCRHTVRISTSYTVHSSDHIRPEHFDPIKRSTQLTENMFALASMLSRSIGVPIKRS